MRVHVGEPCSSMCVLSSLCALPFPSPFLPACHACEGRVWPRWLGSSLALLACLSPLSTLLRRGTREMQRRQAYAAIPALHCTCQALVFFITLYFVPPPTLTGRTRAAVCHRPPHFTKHTTWLLAQHTSVLCAMYQFYIACQWLCIVTKLVRQVHACRANHYNLQYVICELC